MPDDGRATRPRPLLCLTVFVALNVGCGGGGGGSPSATPTPAGPAAPGSLSGVWQLLTTVTSNSCGLPDGGTTDEPITLVQQANVVTIVNAGGLWGSGTVRGDTLEFTGTAVETDEDGCTSTQRASGAVSGSQSDLRGAFTIAVAYDPTSCADRSDCTIARDARLLLGEPYRSSCLDRDTFGPPAESEYVLPFPVGAAYRVSNGYCWPAGGHREQLAYDFDMPIGDPVVAARGGVVRNVKDDSPDDGQGSDHNHVMVEHDDGTVAFYAHLQQGSALVQPGEVVQVGQHIANNGHSGTTDIPHLHFGVYADDPPTEGADRAINFRNTDGPVDCRGGLVMGETYRALEY